MENQEMKIHNVIEKTYEILERGLKDYKIIQSQKQIDNLQNDDTNTNANTQSYQLPNLCKFQYLPNKQKKVKTEPFDIDDHLDNEYYIELTNIKNRLKIMINSREENNKEIKKYYSLLYNNVKKSYKGGAQNFSDKRYGVKNIDKNEHIALDILCSQLVEMGYSAGHYASSEYNSPSVLSMNTDGHGCADDGYSYFYEFRVIF